MINLKKDAIKSTFTLKSDVVDLISQMSHDYGMSKTALVERAIRSYAENSSNELKKPKGFYEYGGDNKNDKTGRYFYNDFDAVFLCDAFKWKFVDTNGVEHDDIVSGASVYATGINVDGNTGRPVYLKRNTDNNGDEPVEVASEHDFTATIDAELGVLIIPKPGVHRDMMRGYKIVSYTIDVGEGCVTSVLVDEGEFKRLICSNFDKFNNPDNYFAQSTSYGYNEVKTQHERVSWYVGYDSHDVPVICDPSNKDEIMTLFSIADSFELAEKYRNLLSCMTPDDVRRNIYMQNKKRAVDMIKEFVEDAKAGDLDGLS